MTWHRQPLRDRSTWLGALIMFVIGTAAGAAIFSRLALEGTNSDLPKHIQLVIDSRTEHTQLGYSIYYTLLEVLSAGGDANALQGAAIAVLASAYGLRLAATWFVFSLTGVGTAVRIVGTLATSIAAPITVATCEYLYLGKLTPVVWHNSTTILAVPFALLLFVSTCWMMMRGGRTWGPQVVQVTLVVLSAWTKPNYLLALMPVLALWFLMAVVATPASRRLTVFKDLWWRIAPSGIAAALVLAVQFVLTYGGPGLQIDGQRVTNIVAPFALWKEWSAQFGVVPLWSVCVSILTPLVLTVLVWRVKRYRLPLTLAWASVLVGLATFTVLAESLEDGTILFHGNWIWGAQISMAVLFVVSVAAFSREFRSIGWLKWVGVALVVYQVAMGAVWLQMLYSGQSLTFGMPFGCQV